MSEDQQHKEQQLRSMVPGLFSEGTTQLISDLLRGFRKGYSVDLSAFFDAYYEGEDDTHKRVIWELCQISGDTFDEVCVWEQWKEADLPYARTEDQGHSPVEPLP